MRATEYYELAPTKRYIYIFYYSCLIVIGNDMAPQTSNEILFSAVIIFLGCFLEAYIIGGITAELIKSENQEMLETKMSEYVKFSLENHLFP